MGIRYPWEFNRGEVDSQIDGNSIARLKALEFQVNPLSLFSLFPLFTTHFHTYASHYKTPSPLEKLIQKRYKSGNRDLDETLGLFNSMIHMQPLSSILTVVIKCMCGLKKVDLSFSIL